MRQLFDRSQSRCFPHSCLSAKVCDVSFRGLDILSQSSLALRVEVAESLDEKINKIVPILQSRAGPAIVYVTLQRHAEDAATKLRLHGIDASVYHAGLPSETREDVQRQFMDSDKGIVCATIAFGMGIDKGEHLCFHNKIPR